MLRLVHVLGEVWASWTDAREALKQLIIILTPSLM